MARINRLWLSGVILLMAASCDNPSDPRRVEVLLERCIGRIATEAINTGRTDIISANYAGPLGLITTAGSESPPYVSKQLQITDRNNNMHFFAVDSPQWTTAALIRVTPTASEPRLFFVIIDRRGSVIRTGRMVDRALTIGNLQDANELREAVAERSVWTRGTAAPDCAELSRIEG